MQKTTPPELLRLLAAVGGDHAIKRTHSGTGPNLYAILESPALGATCSVRWRNSVREPERHGFIVYWPFAAEGQNRRSRLSFDEALALIGSTRPELDPEILP